MLKFLAKFKMARADGLDKPKDIPVPVGQALVVRYKQDPDWVWSLRAVYRPSPENPDREEYRLFDPRDTMAKGIKVRDFNGLDQYPELVVYQGWVDKKTREMVIKKTGPLAKAV